jgi:EAL domain-containing protein (putative c-di-GMP-specific phosphodiesterase class I)
MYRAKEHGRGTYRYFSQDLSTETQRRIALNEAMRGALERHEFELHYQPKADLRTGEVRGVEALLRWRRPTGGLVPPAEFIDSLENSRLILPVGAWVIETACAQLLAWDRQGLPPLSMAVNVSPRQFHDPALIHVVEQALQRTGLDPQRLELEVTESLVMDNQAESAATLARLSALGVRLAIDDFGTGYSSLAYLKQFPVDTLKLDRSFVSGLPGQRDCVAITAAVQVLAQHMQMQVVCEGVETADQRDHLRSQGFELMQGFLLARPMPAEAFLPWWLQQRPQPQRQSPQAPAAAAPAMATVTAKDPVET